MVSRVMKTAPRRGGVPASARRWLYPIYGLLGALLLGVLWFAIAQPVQVLPRIRQAPAFTLTDERGRWLGPEELQGRPALISFSYARCGEACAELNARMAALQPALPADEALLLTISVDPEHDTPDVLRQHAASLGADPERWRFLTGAPAEIKALVGGEFRVYYGPNKAPAGAPLQLDQRAVLLDGAGQLRAEYDLARLETWRVQRDIELLRQEQAGSSGWQRPVYEAAHLFVCYPQ